MYVCNELQIYKWLVRFIKKTFVLYNCWHAWYQVKSVKGVTTHVKRGANNGTQWNWYKMIVCYICLSIYLYILFLFGCVCVFCLPFTISFIYTLHVEINKGLLSFTPDQFLSDTDVRIVTFAASISKLSRSYNVHRISCSQLQCKTCQLQAHIFITIVTFTEHSGSTLSL